MKYDEQKINAIRDMLCKRHETIAAAESVTSGHLQAALSLATEAMRFYQGGITCYNLGQKTKHLNIEPIFGEATNCVHQQVAAKMATEVSRSFISNYGIGITGYATMVPEIEKEGLHAYLAIAHNEQLVLERRLISNKSTPLEVQYDYTNQVIELLLDYLKKEKS